MTSVQKPKRALLAYCALADRLAKPNAGLMEALIPFFAPVCHDLAGKMFDAEQFSEQVSQRYGLSIPRLAVLGLTDLLAQDGLILNISGQGSKAVYKYASSQDASEDAIPAVTEKEVDAVLANFVEICRADEWLKSMDEEALHKGFLERLLHTDSMRLLLRKDAPSQATKESDTTLTLKKGKNLPPDAQEQQQLHLDFNVAQFLLDLRLKKPELFNRVSDIAFANMAAEALACFKEPTAKATSLTDFSVYLDSPLLLDILGVNAEYEDYGQELLGMIQTAGAIPLVFDDAIEEAESVVAARARSSAYQSQSSLGAASPYVLSSLIGQVGVHAAKQGINSKPDPTLDLTRTSRDAVGTIQVMMNSHMSEWKYEDARTHDQRSVWSMLRIRNATKPDTKIREARAVFVTRNTRLVTIANNAWRSWLQEARHHSRDKAERWAPIAMSDKQLAGYLWLRNSGVNKRGMSSARLLAHCSAAIRPRQDVKAKAYNLVLSLHGRQQADIVSALMEDTEGGRALMRATRSDPEDVTPERLPYILEQVKLQAGEFAASRAREEGRIEAESLRAKHIAEIEGVQQAASSEIAKVGAQNEELANDLAQATLNRVQAEAQAEIARKELEDNRNKTKTAAQKKYAKAFLSGHGVYRRLRWECYFLYGSALLFATYRLEAYIQSGVIIALTMCGFWFFPNFFEKPLRIHARWQMKKELKRMDLTDFTEPEAEPDFANPAWAADQFKESTHHTAKQVSSLNPAHGIAGTELRSAQEQPSETVEAR